MAGRLPGRVIYLAGPARQLEVSLLSVRSAMVSTMAMAMALALAMVPAMVEAIVMASKY